MRERGGVVRGAGRLGFDVFDLFHAAHQVGGFFHFADAVFDRQFRFVFLPVDFVLFGFHDFVDAVLAVIFDRFAGLDDGVGAGGLVALEAG